MTDEKILSIQDKIHLEKLKIQEKLQKSVEIPQKIEEKSQKTEKFIPKNFVETKKKIKDIFDVDYKNKIDEDFEKALNRKSEREYSNDFPASTIMAAISILVVGFIMLSVGNFIMSSIKESVTLAEPGTAFSVIDSEIMSYTETLLPLFGLILLVFGTALVLNTLRNSL